jgi:HAE1 family hydrophobic/amphiphilic exporter-1
VILIVPMCLLAAVSGLLLRGMSVDILAQIGFVVLVALASKNAILSKMRRYAPPGPVCVRF